MFGNEMMTYRGILTDASFSNFTLALLKDTGWYADINMDMADPFIWGINTGCTFLDGNCSDLL